MNIKLDYFTLDWSTTNLSIVNELKEQSFVDFYENINVNNVKIDRDISKTFKEAKEAKNYITTSMILFANFANENVNAYYFVPHKDWNSTYSIYKKTYSQKYYDYVCELNDTNRFKDYNIHNDDYYEYMAVVATLNENGEYEYSIYDSRDKYNERIWTKVKWDQWSICNVEETENIEETGILYKTGDTWLLGLNLNDENLSQNLSITSWDTLGKYPKVSIGQRNYNSSSVNCLLGAMKDVISNSDIDDVKYRYTERIDPNNKYGREIEKLLKWKEFCSDGEMKLLKDIKGNSWIVQIIDSPTHDINTISSYLPTSVSFNWQEVENVNDYSIIEEIKEARVIKETIAKHEK